MSSISSAAVTLESTLKSNTKPYYPVFFILATEKSFEMFPKQSGFAKISESFALNLISSVPLANK